MFHVTSPADTLATLAQFKDIILLNPYFILHFDDGNITACPRTHSRERRMLLVSEWV